jgi:WD40 repeat protein
MMKRDQPKRKIGIEFSLPDACVKVSDLFASFECSLTSCNAALLGNRGDAADSRQALLCITRRDDQKVMRLPLIDSSDRIDVSSQISLMHGLVSFYLILRWNLSSASPTFEVSLEGHTDWINDLSYLPQHDLLASCSNDATVRTWRASSDEPGGKVLQCLHYHKDYVTCLSAAPDKGLLCSAGLRGEVFTVDLETGTSHQLYPKSSSRNPHHDPLHPSGKGGGLTGHGVSSQPSSAFSRFSNNLWGGGGASDPKDNSHHGPSDPSHTNSMTSSMTKKQKASIYALSCSPGGALLAFGGTDHIIRLWDPRSMSKVDKLRGHSDTLRALVLSSRDQGRQALSASSDGTVRLWDVGMRRCIEVRPLPLFPPPLPLFPPSLYHE